MNVKYEWIYTLMYMCIFHDYDDYIRYMTCKMLLLLYRLTPGHCAPVTCKFNIIHLIGWRFPLGLSITFRTLFMLMYSNIHMWCRWCLHISIICNYWKCARFSIWNPKWMVMVLEITSIFILTVIKLHGSYISWMKNHFSEQKNKVWKPRNKMQTAKCNH